MNNISVSVSPCGNQNLTAFKGNPKSLVKGVAASAKEVGMSESQIIDGLSDEVQMLHKQGWHPEDILFLLRRQADARSGYMSAMADYKKHLS